MLDVHPPQHTPHTWRDFFIHIATIVVGLCIAVGLEQTVEALHHRNQRAELRESLRRETEEIIRDSKGADANQMYQMSWLATRVLQVQASVWQGQPLAAAATYSPPANFYPDDPIWRSAKTSGLVDLLTSNEVNAYSEVELLAGKIDNFYVDWRTAQSALAQFQRQFPALPDGSPDLSKASAEDMRSLLKLLTAEEEAARMFREWDLNLLGAEETIASGNLNLQDIFVAEKARAHPVEP